MKKFVIPTAVLALSVCATLTFAQSSNAPRTFQATEVTTFGPAGTTPDSHGAAWLRRSKNSLEGRVSANVDLVGFPYTIWFVIFNKPENCDTIDDPVLDVLGNKATDCDDGDFAAAEASIFHASNSISAHNTETGMGVINIDVSVVAGQLPAGTFNPFTEGVFNGAGPAGVGLQRGNGFKADVHMVVDEHSDLALKAGTTDWVLELTRPEPGGTVRAMVFAPVD